MAKANVDERSRLARFGECFWIPGHNLARPSGNMGTKSERDSRQKMLAKVGWSQNAAGLLVADLITNTWEIDGTKKPLKDFVAKEMEERHKQWDAYQINARSGKEENVNMLKAWEALFVESDKDGKKRLMPIKYVMGAGYCRSDVYPAAMADRLTLKEEDEKSPDFGKPLQVVNTIPILIEDMSSYEDRFELVVRANTDTTRNFLMPSAVDQLMNAKDMIGRGLSQIRVREVSSSSTIGVKNYWLIVMDKRYPKVRIYERCIMDKDHIPDGLSLEDTIPLAGVKHDDLQIMGSRLPENFEETNRKLRAKSKPQVEILTESQVKVYFDDVRKGFIERTNIQVMKKESIKNLKLNGDNEIAKLVAGDIYDNKDTGIKRANAVAIGCNCLLQLLDDNDYPNAEKILLGLTKVAKGPVRDKLEKQLLDVLGIK